MDIIVIVTLIYSIPLSALGIWWIITTQLKPRVMMSRGRFLVRRLMPNGRFREKWVKPEYIERKKEIEVPFTGADGKEKVRIDVEIHHQYMFRVKDEILPFYDAPGSIYMDGNKKVALYDVEGNQVIIPQLQKVAMSMSGQMMDALYQRTWNVARALAFAEKKRLMMILMIVLIAAVAAAGAGAVAAYSVTQLSEKLTAMQGTLNTVLETVKTTVLTPTG